MRPILRPLLLVLGLAALLAACSAGSTDSDAGQVAVPEESEPEESAPEESAPEESEPGSSTATTVATESTTTTPVDLVVFDNDFGDSIAPVLSNRCASCHNEGGPGSTHWKLTTAADAVSAAPFILPAITSGVMPPWPAGPQSIAFKDDRSLRPDELAAIVDWVNAGSPLDVADTTPIERVANPTVLGSVDASITPAEPYQGSPDKTDDYRCLVYDLELTESSWVVGYNFVPDQSEVVHHAIGYLATAADRVRAESKDANEPGAGWECFGGSGLRNDDLFLGWAPGQGPTVYPEGSGLRLEPGDFIVIQIHYHFDNEAPADLSTLELDFGASGDLDEIQVAEYLAPAEIPCSKDESGPLCDRDAALRAAVERYGPEGVLANDANNICGATPADFAAMTDGVASSSCDLPIYSFGEIVSVLGHEHEIGSSFRMTLNPDTPEQKILLDIPKWDFDWQYNYYPAESIELRPGNVVRIECSWDRSLRDPDLEPAYILWADGTNDEMCFSTIITR